MLTEGTFSVDGIIQTCSAENLCMTSSDIARGHFPYITNWFWISIQFIQPDGTRIGINLSDGRPYQDEDDLDWASGDGIFVDGKFHKLDSTRI